MAAMPSCKVCHKEVADAYGKWPEVTSVKISVSVNQALPLYWSGICCSGCFVRVGGVLATLQEGIDELVRDPQPCGSGSTP